MTMFVDIEHDVESSKVSWAIQMIR